ncbi:MAG: hypothetical protein R2752_09540 [Vicinamibacterales bacterium]
MKLSSSLSALRRQAVLAVGLAALVCAASGVKAQDAAAGQDPAPAQQQDPLKFSHNGEVMILWAIKPERTADFESVWTTIKGALAQNADANLRALGQSIKISKVDLPAGGPGVLYVFLLSPASTQYSYNPVTLLFETLKAPDADPAATTPAPKPAGTFTYDEAQEVFKKFDGSYNQINPWPLKGLGM